MITLTGASVIKKKFNTRAHQMSRNAEFIFVKPLGPIVREIKKNVISDSFKGGRSHVVTGDLLRSVGTEYTQLGFGLDFKIKIKFGYFIRYGLNLEAGNRARLKLATNVDFTNVSAGGYPIIRPVWQDKKDEYFREVMRRVEKIWR